MEIDVTKFFNIIQNCEPAAVNVFEKRGEFTDEVQIGLTYKEWEYSFSFCDDVLTVSFSGQERFALITTLTISTVDMVAPNRTDSTYGPYVHLKTEAIELGERYLNYVIGKLP